MDKSSSHDGAEYKLVTILFADVVGSTTMGGQLGAETYRLIMDRCLRQLSKAIDTFGESVLSY